MCLCNVFILFYVVQLFLFLVVVVFFFFFKQMTAYEMLISDWSSDVCSSDLMASGRLAMPAFPATASQPSSWNCPQTSTSDRHGRPTTSIGRAGGRERVCKYG